MIFDVAAIRERLRKMNDAQLERPRPASHAHSFADCLPALRSQLLPGLHKLLNRPRTRHLIAVQPTSEVRAEVEITHSRNAHSGKTALEGCELFSGESIAVRARIRCSMRGGYHIRLLFAKLRAAGTQVWGRVNKSAMVGLFPQWRTKKHSGF